MKADALILAAEASLKDAELDLAYCEVRSPIDGIPGRNLVDVGNLVDAGQKTHLTTVVQISPIWVYFDVPERFVNEARRSAQGKDQERTRPLEVAVATPGDEGFPHRGVLSWASNEVNPDTGTLRARAVFENPDKRLYSGVFVRVRIETDVVPDALVIEEKAIATDLAGKYVLVVGEDGVVERRGVTLGQREGAGRVVTDGLAATDRYIVSGMLRARPGLPVTVTKSDAGG